MKSVNIYLLGGQRIDLEVDDCIVTKERGKVTDIKITSDSLNYSLSVEIVMDHVSAVIVKAM